VDKLRPLEDELMIGEETQKHENKSAQEIITEIKRENKETSEAIVKTFEKVTLPARSSNISKLKLDSTIDHTAYNSQNIYYLPSQPHFIADCRERGEGR